MDNTKSYIYVQHQSHMPMSRATLPALTPVDLRVVNDEYLVSVRLARVINKDYFNSLVTKKVQSKY